jgi:hypothetical protein
MLEGMVAGQNIDSATKDIRQGLEMRMEYSAVSALPALFNRFVIEIAASSVKAEHVQLRNQSPIATTNVVQNYWE